MGLAAATTLLVMACGFMLARRALQASGPASSLEALAWAPAVGFGCSSLIYFAWRLLGAPGPGRGSVVALALLSALAYVLGRGRSPATAAAAGGQADETSHPPRIFRWGGWSMLALTAIGLVLAFHRWSTRWPLGTADAVNIWNSRGRFLLYGRENPAELLRLIERGHPDYPLLLPGSLAAQAGFWGDWDQALAQATGAAFVLGLGLITFVGLRRLRSGHLAAAGAALVLASPPVWRWGFSQCADLPLAYLLAAAGIGLATHLDGPSRRAASPLLVGFALGLLPWIKNDGLVPALALGGLFSLSWLLQPPASRASYRTLAAIAAGALPGLLTVFLFKLLWAPPAAADLWLGHSPVAKLLDGERWSTVLSTVGTTLDPFDPSSGWRWVLVFLVLSVLVLGTGRGAQRPPLAFLVTSLALTASGYLVAYVLSPYDLVWHVSKSVDRLLLHLLPLAVVWSLAHSRLPDRRKATGRHPAAANERP